MTREQLTAILAEEERLSSSLDVLNDREVEIISLMGQGSNSAQICQELFVTRENLDAAKKEMRRKLKLKDEVALVQFAAQQGR